MPMDIATRDRTRVMASKNCRENAKEEKLEGKGLTGYVLSHDRLRYARPQKNPHRDDGPDLKSGLSPFD